MNHNEEVPDFLGGLGDMLPANVLKVLNELLEQQHRKDKNHQGSTVFIYAPGSQYVDKQFNIGAYPRPSQREGERDAVPRKNWRGGTPKGRGERSHTPDKDTMPRGVHPRVHRTADGGAVWRGTAVLSARSLAGGVSHTGG